MTPSNSADRATSNGWMPMPLAISHAGTPMRSSAAIQKATLGAAEPPIQVGLVAMRIVALADGMVEPANPNVLSDVGVAAATARAALSGSITNITVNAAFLTDDELSRDLLDRVGELERAMEQADDVAARIVERLKK